MDQHAQTPSRTKPPTPGSWRPGQSGNPKGRPRKGNALTESIQAGCDPDELRDIALSLARNGESESTRIAALNWLRDSGYTRPAERHELGPAGSMDDQENDALADALTLDELDELDRLDDERAKLLDRARQRVSDPLAVDGDVALLPAGVAPTVAK